MTLSGLTSVASADSDSDDGPKVGTDVVVTSPPGGSEEEWNQYMPAYDELTETVLPALENPGSIPIEKCYTKGSHEVCLSTPGKLQYETKDCANGTTPPLYWTTMTASDTVDGVLQVEVQIWIGLTTDGCFYAGNEDALICEELGCNAFEKKRNLDTNPTGFASIPDSLGQWMADNPEIVIGGTTTGGLAVASASVASGGGGGGVAFSMINGVTRE